MPYVVVPSCVSFPARCENRHNVLELTGRLKDNRRPHLYLSATSRTNPSLQTTSQLMSEVIWQLPHSKSQPGSTSVGCQIPFQSFPSKRVDTETLRLLVASYTQQLQSLEVCQVGLYSGSMTRFRSSRPNYLIKRKTFRVNHFGGSPAVDLRWKIRKRVGPKLCFHSVISCPKVSEDRLYFSTKAQSMTQ